MSEKNISIATLSCSFNRVNKTAAFLKTVLGQKIPDNYLIDVFLLDDNSPDDTAGFVKTNFPKVQVLSGSGSLFWAGGMRTLWKEVLKKGKYDFYLLLNDDVLLDEDAIARLIAAYKASGSDANIILGTVQEPVTKSISYGGHKVKSKLTGYSYIQQPHDSDLIPCEIGNANIMLVDSATVAKIGVLSEAYTHGLADFDYTYTAHKNGVKVWLAPGYFGYCENDHGANWLSKGSTLKKRIQYLYSPKGLAYKEYLSYVGKHFPLMLPTVFFKAWLKTLFPFVYDNLKKS